MCCTLGVHHTKTPQDYTPSFDSILMPTLLDKFNDIPANVTIDTQDICIFLILNIVNI